MEAICIYPNKIRLVTNTHNRDESRVKGGTHPKNSPRGARISPEPIEMCRSSEHFIEQVDAIRCEIKQRLQSGFGM